MTALAADRNTPQRDGDFLNDPVAANAKIYAGSLVVLNATGYAAPGTLAAGLIARGRADEQVDNTGGADGAVNVDVRAGVFSFANAGDITRAHIGDDAYIDDDQTVTAVTTGRSVAGRIVDVDSDGVWVKVG